MKQLKERACIKGKMKTWISECSEDQLYHLFQRLRAGESARSIAQFVQETWKINPQSDIHSVSQGILKFKKRIDDLLELEIAEQTCRGLEEANLTEDECLDELMGLERLVRLQRERVERMMREEQEKGIKHPNLSRDLQSLASLSKVLTREKEFALKHPKDNPIKMREEQIRDQRIDANFNTFMANTTDESRERLMCAMDKFLKRAAEISIPMITEKDENGKIRYVPIEEGDT